MKKRILIIVALILLIPLVIWQGMRWYGRYIIAKSFDGSDIFLSKNRVLIDSLKFSGHTFYWFSYDNGTFGHTSDYISIDQSLKEISNQNAFFSSSFMSSISILNRDTMLIKLTTKDFIIDSTRLKFPLKIELESEGSEIIPTARKNTPLE